MFHFRLLVLYILFLCFSSLAFSQKEAVSENELYLLQAVKTGNYDNVKLGLNSSSPNITDEYGISILMYAIQKKRKLIIEELIEAGANPNYRIKIKSKSNDDRSPVRMLMLQHQSVLDFAVNTQDTTIVRQILKAGAKINPKDEILNPLMQASKNLDYSMLIYLKGQGAKVSKKTARDIAALTITSSTGLLINQTPKGRKEVIRFWDNYGVDISEENLLKSPFSTSGSNQRSIKNFIKIYDEWIDSNTSKNEEKTIRSAAYADYIDPEYEAKAKAREEARGDSLFEKALKNVGEYKDWRKEYDEQEEKENTARITLVYLAVGISIVLLFIYGKYGSLNRATWDTIFRKLFRVQLQPNQNQNKRNRNNTANPPNPTRPKPQKKAKTQRKSAQKPQPAVSVSKTKITETKGWSVDSTTIIELQFLTIEDMINPILLCNEHEKSVRRMMWYMRCLENHTDEQIEQVLGNEGLLPHLESLWKSIKPTYIRAVYKRSLYLMVENYRERDERVSIFLESIKRHKPRGNKPKKKSEKKPLTNS